MLPTTASSGEIDGADFAEDGDADFAGVGHFGLDAFGDVAGDEFGGGVVAAFGIDDDADFAAGLDGEGLADALEARGDAFEFLQALDVAFEGFAAGTGAGAGDGVGGHDDRGVGAGGGDIVVVSADGVEDGFGLVEFADEFHAEGGVAAFLIVVHGFADVVEESGAAGEGAVETEFIGDHLAEEGDFDGVAEDVLAVAGAVVESADLFGDFGMEAGDVAFEDGFFAHLADVVFDFLLGEINDFLDARGVDAAVGDEFFHGDFRDFAADGIEAVDGDDAGGVVDDDIDAGGLLEGADVAAFAADDAAFHVVAGNLHALGGAFAGDFGGVALHRLEQDVRGFLLGFFLGLVFDAGDHEGGIVAGFVFDAAEEELAGFVRAHAGDAKEHVFLLGERFVELLFFAFDVFLAVGEAAFRCFRGFFP